jgi:hypothetical protein
MFDTPFILLLLALNGLTCAVAYLIGHKVGLRDGFAYARRVKIMAANANR